LRSKPRAYDPAGTASASGAANDWPFLYQSGEKEVTDPGPLYYSGGGQFYSPQLVRSLSETSQTSSHGSNGGPAGKAIAGPPGGGNGSFGHWYVCNVLEPMEPGQFNAGDLPDIFVGDSEGGFVIPVGEIAQFIEEWVSFFEWLFGGSSPAIPRQLLHARHPLYRKILAVSDGLIVTEESEGKPEFCGDAEFCGTTPLQAPEYRKAPPQTMQPTQQSFTDCMISALKSQLVIFPIVCAPSAAACSQVEAPFFSVPSCRVALGACGITAGIVAGCVAGVPGPQ
jgi:hypothetical protein